MYGFWYNYIKPKYIREVKLCYIETDNLLCNFLCKYWKYLYKNC